MHIDFSRDSRILVDDVPSGQREEKFLFRLVQSYFLYTTTPLNIAVMVV